MTIMMIVVADGRTFRGGGGGGLLSLLPLLLGLVHGTIWLTVIGLAIYFLGSRVAVLWGACWYRYSGRQQLFSKSGYGYSQRIWIKLPFAKGSDNNKTLTWKQRLCYGLLLAAIRDSRVAALPGAALMPPKRF